MSTFNIQFSDSANQVIDSINRIVPNIPMALFVLAIGFLAIRFLSWLIKHSLKLTRLPIGLQEIIVKLLDIGLWILLLITFFQFLGLSNISLALTGAFSLAALGFSQGLSSVVADVAAGLSLGNDKHFNVGDRIKTGDFEGVIVEMDLKKTRLRDDEDLVHILPNSLIDKAAWTLIEHGHRSTAPGLSYTILQRGKRAKRQVRRRKVAKI